MAGRHRHRPTGLACMARQARPVVVAALACAALLFGGVFMAAAKHHATHHSTVEAPPGPGGPSWLEHPTPSPVAAILAPGPSPTDGVSPTAAPPPPTPGTNGAGAGYSPAPTARATGGGTRPGPQPSPVPPATSAPPPEVHSYEAESGANTLGGSAQRAGCAPCSGGGEVRWVGYSGTLQVNGVVTRTGGTARLTIAYLNGDGTTRWCLISIDGGRGTWVSFPSTGGWNTVGTVTLAVGVRAGTNRFLFAFSRGWGPDFDAFTVRDPVG